MIGADRVEDQATNGPGAVQDDVDGSRTWAVNQPRRCLDRRPCEKHPALRVGSGDIQLYDHLRARRAFTRVVFCQCEGLLRPCRVLRVELLNVTTLNSTGARGGDRMIAPGCASRAYRSDRQWRRHTLPGTSIGARSRFSNHGSGLAIILFEIGVEPFVGTAGVLV